VVGQEAGPASAPFLPSVTGNNSWRLRCRCTGSHTTLSTLRPKQRCGGRPPIEQINGSLKKNEVHFVVYNLRTREMKKSSINDSGRLGCFFILFVSYM
jgi:hypothetical protein